MRNVYRLITAAEALDDLSEIHAYIAVDSLEAANKVYDEIEKRIDDLANLPYMYRVYLHRRNPDRTIHAMSVNPYIVYYRVSEKNLSVDILRVLHSARRQPRRFP